MGNKKRQKRQQTGVDKQQPKSPKFTTSHKNIIALSILVIFVLIYYSEFIFLGKQTAASDTMAFRGNAQSLVEAREKDGSNPLWANNLFCGMPGTMVSIVAPFEQPAKYLLKGIRKLINWPALYLILGGLGIFLIMRFWNFSPLISLFSAMAFILWPQLSGLLEAGHNTKYNTMMLAPLSIFLYLQLIKKPDVLKVALFIIVFSLNMQERHIQIVFYIGLLLLAFTITEFIVLLNKKEYRIVGNRLIYIAVAFAFTLGLASFPTLMVREYAQYSIRGGSEQEKSDGLDYDYATGWSLHPAESATFLIPRFYGGDSRERYEGDAVPELRGKMLPGYWGHKPFTTSSDYIGVIALIFAIYAAIYLWRDRYVLTLMIVAGASIFIAFGNFFPLLYDVFFNLVPFFNKFRVPSMILFLVQICITLLAGFGLGYVVENIKNGTMEKYFIRKTMVIFAILLFIGLLPFLFKDAFAFSRPDEVANYRADMLSFLKNVRYDLMKQDAIRMLFFTGGAFILLLSFIKGWISKNIFAGAIIILLVIDMYGINKREMQNLVKETKLQYQFSANAVDKFLKSDTDLYRIFPLGSLYGDSHWSYRHQSIGGYHPAKLRIIQDINESCLYQGRDKDFQNKTLPINWNIVNMLSTKYVLSQNSLEHPNLQLVFNDKQTRINVYKNIALLARIYPIGQVEVIQDPKDRFSRLNDASFNPGVTAILERKLEATIAQPGQFKFNITRYEPNYIEFDVETDQQTLLVLSEMYYPAGWKAYVDDQPVEIIKTNHILRSILVSEGKHHIRFAYQPKTYTASLWIMGLSIIITYLALIVSLIPFIKQQKFLVK
jgi:hypothetical protein